MDGRRDRCDVCMASVGPGDSRSRVAGPAPLVWVALPRFRRAGPSPKLFNVGGREHRTGE